MGKIEKTKQRVLLIYRGLPGCGKTTAAKALMAANPKVPMVRINNDDLCLAVNNTVNIGAENVTAIRETLLALFMSEGKYIILDNTNLAQKRIDAYEELVAQFNKERPAEEHYSIVYEDMTSVPMWVCHERNNRRAAPVPPRVITDMFKAHILPTLPCRKFDPTLPNAVVVDIDGTVSRMCSRSPYDHTKYSSDTVYTEIWEQIKAIRDSLGYTLVFLTGRKEIGRDATVKWLADNLSVADPILHMREDHNSSESDFVYKERMATYNILPKFNIKAWFEDRLRNVEMARYRLGVEAVYQVNEGSF